MSRTLPASILVTLLVATPACASQGALYRYPTGGRGVDQRAYTVGYDEGRQHGEQDARRRRSFDYHRHDDYRDADDGYRGGGDRNSYRSRFRQGFVAGYNDGYRQYSQGGYSQGGYPQGRYPRGPSPQGGYGSTNHYGSSPAAQSGYRDGYEQGRDDARDRDRFDPVGARRYRSGDQDYDRRYGSRDDYKREYRAAFQTGYEQGYRGWRR